MVLQLIQGVVLLILGVVIVILSMQLKRYSNMDNKRKEAT